MVLRGGMVSFRFRAKVDEHPDAHVEDDYALGTAPRPSKSILGVLLRAIYSFL